MNIHDPRFKIALFIHRHALKFSGVCLLVCLGLVIAGEFALSWVFTLLIGICSILDRMAFKRYLEPVVQQTDDFFNAPGEDAIEQATEYEIRQLREMVEEEGGKVSVFDAHLRTCERPLIRRDILRAHMLAMGNE